MGCVIVRRDFAEKNPEKVSAFLDAYKASVEMVNTDPAAAGELVQKHGVMPKAAVAARAIPNCHIVFVEGAQMRQQIEPLYNLLHFQVLKVNQSFSVFLMIWMSSQILYGQALMKIIKFLSLLDLLILKQENTRQRSLIRITNFLI